MLKKFHCGILKRWNGKALSAPDKAFDQYIASAPSQQNAIDLVPGWSTCFPPEFGLTAGKLPVFDDQRIHWAIAQYGSLQDKRVLELGPLEAGHTYMLEKAGAYVDAIEANKRAFLRCLIFKEIMGLTRARFWLGDFTKWLRMTDKTYDLVIASGVLYHMRDPLELISLIAQRSASAFFWTHVASETDMPANDERRAALVKSGEVHDFHGVRVRTYRRTYMNAPQHIAFCGGPEDEHRWIEKDDLLAALRAVGFTRVETSQYEPNHVFGPAICIYASK